MPGEILTESRGFFARLPNPPRLDARALLWWGIGLAAFRLAWNAFISEYATGGGPQALLDLPLSDLFLTAAFMLGQLGIVLVAVALGGRGLDARALLWWGIGLIVIGLAWGKFLPDLVANFDVPLYDNLAFRLVVDAVSTSTMLGIALVAVAFGVRSQAPHGERESPISDH